MDEPRGKADAGRRLKELRQEMSASQREFGEPVGLNQSAVSAFEQGKVAFKKPDALAVEYVYGVRHEWLLFGLEPKIRNTPKLSDEDIEVLGIYRSLGLEDRALWLRLGRLLALAE